MSNANQVSGYRAARRYRRAAFGLLVAGVLAGFVAGRFGYDLLGFLTYVVAALAGFGIIAYVRLSDSLAMGDERLCELERRASHYAVTLFGGLGWVGLIGVVLLDATGQRELTATDGTLLAAFGVFWVVWAAIYLALRVRR